MTQKPPPPSGAPGLIDNLSGTVDIMLGRASGLKRMDLSDNGFWTSFSGLFLAGLIDASSLSVIYNRQVAIDQLVQGKLHFVLGTLLVSLISYGASLIALYLICQDPAEQARVPVAVVVHNWASPLISLAFLPLLWATGIGIGAENQQDAVANMLSIVWLGLLVLVGLRLMRFALDVPLSRAGALFAITAIVSLVCSKGLERLIGLGGAS